MSGCPAENRSDDVISRLIDDLRASLRAAEGEPAETAKALESLARLEKLVILLRSTALQSFGEYEQRVFELSLIRRVGSLFSSVFEREQLVATLIDLVLETLPADGAALYLKEPTTGALELERSSGPGITAIGRSRAEQYARGVAIRRDAKWLVENPATGARALLCPIVAQAESLGVLVIHEDESGSLSEGAARTIADLAAVALRHASLWEKHRRQQEALEDTVEKRTREVATARAALSQQERVAAMGKLAASIAHEVNNPMSFMISNLGRAAEHAELFQRALPELLAAVSLSRRLPDSEDPHVRGAREAAQRAQDAVPPDALEAAIMELGDLIRETREGADRICCVGDQMRGFARGISGAMEPLDLNGLLETAVHVARAEAKDRIRFDCRLGMLPQVRGNRYQLIQLLLNLLQNAVEATEQTGSVCVTTRARDDFVEVEVQDEGPGIEPDRLEEIFEPFYTTKSQGTGLGLSVSRDIARLHRGTLEAGSGPDGGVFRLRLPVA